MMSVALNDDDALMRARTGDGVVARYKVTARRERRQRVAARVVR